MDSTDKKISHVWRLFGFTYSITASYILCRAVADAVLLTRLGSESLPIMIVLGALTVGVVSFVWARRTRKQRLPRVIRITQLSTAFATGSLFVLLKTYPESSLVIGSLYLLAELRSCLSAILIALLLNYGGDRDADKRPFAFVNAGAPLAGITLGIFIGAEATVLPASTLLLLCCGFDLTAWAIIARSPAVSKTLLSARKLRSHAPPTILGVNKLAPSHRDSAIQNKVLEDSTLSFGKLILAVVVCKTVVLTLVDFKWKVLAAEHYSISEGQLTSYFGIFYAAADALTLALQLTMTKYFLRGKAMAFGLYLLPAYLMLLAMAFLLTSSTMVLFWLMTLARGSLVIRRGLYDVIVQVLYGWLPRRSRRATVASILGIAKPIAEATTAVSIVGFATFNSAENLEWLWLPALLIWVIVLKRLIDYWKMLPSQQHDQQPS